MSDLRKISKEERMSFLRVMSSKCRWAHTGNSKRTSQSLPISLAIPNEHGDYGVAEVVVDNVIGFEKSCLFIRWEFFRMVNFCRCRDCDIALTEVEQQFHQYLMHEGYELERMYMNNVETSTFLILDMNLTDTEIDDIFDQMNKTTPIDDTATVVGDEIES